MQKTIQEIWVLSYPIMLSLFSGSCAFFINRTLLNLYCPDTMNAVMVSHLIASTFLFGFIGIILISNITLGQYYGARKYNLMGNYTWQLIWFSLATSIVFLTVNLSAEFLLPSNVYAKSRDYFYIIVGFSAFELVNISINSFLISIGLQKKTLTITLFINGLHLLLDLVLIFGYRGILPPLGAKGAAIALVIAHSIQIILYLIIFLSKELREQFLTNKYNFNYRTIKLVLKEGILNSISITINIMYFSIISHSLAKMEAGYLNLYSFGLIFIFSFSFFFEGLQQGITIITARMIGRNNASTLRIIEVAGIKISGIFISILFLCMIFFSEPIKKLFFGNLINLSLERQINLVFLYLFLFLAFECIYRVLIGVQFAFGYIRYIPLVNIIVFFFFAVLPIIFIPYIFYDTFLSYSWFFMMISALGRIIIHYIKRKQIIFK